MKKGIHISIIILVMMCSTGLVYGQEGTRIILGGKPINKISFYQYAEDNKVKAEYKDTLDAKNECPETLMKSYLSCSNQNWLDYNTWGGSANSDKKSELNFQKIKSMDKEKNYMQLIHRLDYEEDSIPFSIIKFYLHSENSNSVRSGIIIMKKINGRWYTTSFNNNLNTAMMLMRIKSEVLYQIFSQNISIDVVKNYFQDIYTTHDNEIDLVKISNKFKNIYETNNVELKKLVVDENAW